MVQKNSSQWQGALPTLSLTSFHRICANHLLLQSLAWPNLNLQMEKNYPHCSIIFWVEMFAVPSASIPHSIPLSHSSWGTLKVCTCFSVTGGGVTTDPFLLQGSCSAAKLGQCSLMPLHHPPGGKRRVICGGILSCPAPIPGLMSLVWFGLLVGLWNFQVLVDLMVWVF